MIRLHINIDHVATLRNQRDVDYPDPVEAARICMASGADGITAHLREDRRHIRDADVFRLRELLDGGLNLEMAGTEEMARIAGELRPDAVTLVPEKREERTTEGGLDVAANRSSILRVAEVCERVGARLSLFIEPTEEQVRLSHQVGAKQIEFHTGHYCDAPEAQQPGMLPSFEQAALLAHELGLEVAAGHGLTRQNVGPIARLPHLAELNIGHSVIADAVTLGLAEAVKQLRSSVDIP